MKSNTNTVQSFIRGLAWIVSMLVFSVFLAMLAGVSNLMFGTPAVFVIPGLLISMYLSGIIAGMFYILPEWQEMVILKLGKFDSVKGAGFFIIPPFIYSVAAIVDRRIETQQVEATATLTKDNVPTKVQAAIEFRVEDARKAVIDVQNYRLSVTWLSTEALKNTIGSLSLRELLSERDQIAEALKVQIDQGAADYGVDVRAVRITDIDTPETLIEELAVIARAQRNAEAKRVEAEAEVLVAEQMAKAATILTNSKAAMKLREMQILSEMSKEESATIIVYPYGDTMGENIAAASAGVQAK